MFTRGEFQASTPLARGTRTARRRTPCALRNCVLVNRSTWPRPSTRVCQVRKRASSASLNEAVRFKSRSSRLSLSLQTEQTSDTDSVTNTLERVFLVSSYGGKCSADIQCSINITRAICAKTAGRKDGKDVAPGATESGICVCSEGNHYRHGKCLKKRRKRRNDLR